MGTSDIPSKIIGLFDHTERRRVWALLLLIVVAGLIETAGVVSIMPFLAVVATPEAVDNSAMLRSAYQFLGSEDVEQFILWLGLLTVAVISVSNGVAALTAWAIFRFTYHQGYRLGQRLLKCYLSQPYVFFLTHNTLDLARNVYDEVPRVVSGVVLPSMQVVSKSVSVVMILTLLMVVDVMLAAIVLCTFAAAYYVLHTTVQRRLMRVRDVASRSRAASFRLASEALSGIKELKILGREAQCLRAYALPAMAVADADASNQLLGTVPKYLLETLAFGGIVVVVLFMLARNESRAAALPLMALYAFAGYRLLPALQQIYSNLNYVQYYSPSLRLLDAQFAEAARCMLPDRGGDPTDALVLKSSIEFSGVTFKYPTAAMPVLTDMDLLIHANTIVGIVGRTGGGKSTALDILIGLLQPTSGVLRVDGVTLAQARLRAWQNGIGYVPQQIYLSDGTVAENIAFGAPREEIDMDRIAGAAKAAQLHDFINDELPTGYETVIGERGIRLSGGQRQRIGIARALYRDPSLLVLDEATSALDNLTEAAIMDSLRRLSRQKTVVLVAHRFTTLRLCDRIIVVADGRVSAQGSYDELLSSSDLFRELERAGHTVSDHAIPNNAL